MALNREEMMKLLQQKFPEIKLKTTEQFFGTSENEGSGIWCGSAEDHELTWKKKRIFYYYNEFPKRYVNGVLKEFDFLLEINGWCIDWYDPGTVMFYAL